ncbi:helix-turn-helix transcriptional regulator [Photobacterium profundum]|uniref:helix-turn-helix transcriptional regulator n=1 Tax=Photobacterium profundum TaxID=74109 RepID=UPI00059BECCD|nr:AlpA family phage regulatory protein [Photobacterium profundum]
MNTNQVILRPKDLSKKLGISLTTIWRWRKNKSLPEPIYFTEKTIGWHESTIDSWLSDKMLTASQK